MNHLLSMKARYHEMLVKSTAHRVSLQIFDISINQGRKFGEPK